MNVVAADAAPGSFLWGRWVDRLRCMIDPEGMRTHLLVERWMLDEFAMPGTLFAELVERLYREDRFMRGELIVGAETAAAVNVTAPVLLLVNENSGVVPPAAQLPLMDVAVHPRNRVVQYTPDVGVNIDHAGALVGRSAHLTLWPEVAKWAANCFGR
jgi:polyhydroxyalkanoate synthase subunit PhaC